MSGSYGYFVTLGFQPITDGGSNCDATDPAAGVERADDARTIEAVGDCLAHADVVERLDRLVDRHVADVERRAVHDLRLLVPDGRDILRLDVVVPVDLAGLQRLQAGCVVGDRAEDEPPQERLLAPVLVVADERQLVADLPRFQLVGACAGRMLRAVGAARKKTPSFESVPLLAPYFFIAVGLWMPNGISVSAPRNGPNGFLSLTTALRPFGRTALVERVFAVGPVLKPPKTRL